REDSRGSVFLIVEGVSLRPGRYDLTVAASDPRAAEYSPYVHHHRAYSLEVEAGNDAPEGLVTFPNRWVHTTDWAVVRGEIEGVDRG
ncbi:MAG: hypothetical protein MUF84_20830, partial [Anaerolineae bacterium]|nr:hypothetical protein [Anaerolineae bacterium]